MRSSQLLAVSAQPDCCFIRFNGKMAQSLMI
jgi:hypothetical protein